MPLLVSLLPLPPSGLVRQTNVGIKAQAINSTLPGPQLCPLKRKKQKERGIAAGQGASCGFGMQGQKSRSGSGVHPGFEGGQMPLYQRLPKLKVIAGGMGAGLPKYVPAINISDIPIAGFQEVSLESLKSKGPINPSGRDRKLPLKRGCAVPCTPSIESDDEEIFSEDERMEDSSTGSPNSRESWIFRLRRKAFELSKTEKTWTVPWTSFTIIQVMFLWFCTFWLVGSWIIPLAAYYIGCSKDTLTYRGQALYSLITDVAEGTVGLCILHRCLARFKPLPRDWFPINWRGQWYIDVLLGCLMFPVVNRLSQINIELLPFPSPLISSYEKSIMARDPIASILYAIVVSVCCPIWEEVIFRGFLLPSLTRYLPMWASILVSALVFGMAHFNVQRMLPLTFLGLVMGIMFVRSRNLLSSMLLHSLWNGFVFLGLLR